MRSESTIPVGFCQCGCGGRTKISKNTNPLTGSRYGHLLRFIHGHNVIPRKTRPPDERIPNPTGLCQCGCSETTPVAPKRKSIYYAGEHVLFAAGHSKWTSTPEWIIAENGCWPWQRGIDATSGYGILRHRKGAHRYVYTRLKGPIPDGLDLDHLCHNRDPLCPGGATCLHRRCVNPDHLEPVTGPVNTLRGKSTAALNLKKTHCSKGHPYDTENTRLKTDQHGRTCRRCKACDAAYAAKWWARQKVSA